MVLCSHEDQTQCNLVTERLFGSLDQPNFKSGQTFLCTFSSWSWLDVTSLYSLLWTPYSWNNHYREKQTRCTAMKVRVQEKVKELKLQATKCQLSTRHPFAERCLSKSVASLWIRKPVTADSDRAVHRRSVTHSDGNNLHSQAWHTQISVSVSLCQNLKLSQDSKGNLPLQFSKFNLNVFLPGGRREIWQFDDNIYDAVATTLL